MIDPHFQGVNKLFVLYFVNKNEKSIHTGYYLPKVDIKDYNVKIDDRNVFDQSINDYTKTYENIRKIPTGQEDEYITGWLLNYPYFRENCKMIAIYLSKQQGLDADPRAIQQINFTANLDCAGNATMFFIIEEAKKLS